MSSFRFRLTLLGFALLGSTPCVASAQAQWVTTREKCTFHVSMSEPTIQVSSNIPCVNGKLEGEGVLRFYALAKTACGTCYPPQELIDGKYYQFWEIRVEEARRLRFVAGQVVPTLRPSDYSIAMASGPGCRGSDVKVSVSSSLALEAGEIVDSLFALAKQFRRSACPEQTREPRIAVCAGPPGEECQYSNHTDLIESYPSYVNTALNKMRMFWEKRRLEQLDSLAKSERASRANRGVQDRASRLAELVKKYGQFQIVQLSAISTNPFAWQGKLIGTCMFLEQMTSSSTAMLRGGSAEGALLISVPTTRFPTQGRFFFIAKVAGQSTANGGIPSLRYIAAFDQTKSLGCGDYIDW